MTSTHIISTADRVVAPHGLDDFQDQYGDLADSSYDDRVAYIAKAVVEAGVCNAVNVVLKGWSPFAQTTGIELTDLFAEEPGSGGGTKVMTLLGRLADELEITVYLRPESARNRNEFYPRFGFVDDKRNYGFMARYPALPADFDDDISSSEFSSVNASGNRERMSA